MLGPSPFQISDIFLHRTESPYTGPTRPVSGCGLWAGGNTLETFLQGFIPGTGAPWFGSSGKHVRAQAII